MFKIFSIITSEPIFQPFSIVLSPYILCKIHIIHQIEPINHPKFIIIVDQATVVSKDKPVILEHKFMDILVILLQTVDVHGLEIVSPYFLWVFDLLVHKKYTIPHIETTFESFIVMQIIYIIIQSFLLL